MMNGNEDNVDLGLTLGYSTSCTHSRLNNNSGAGVNAGPSVDMTFAASDPLSELVWSPHKGLSLKCADCTKADKKPFLLWNVGSSNVVPSPSQSIRFQENEEEKIVDGNLILTHAMPHVDSKVAQKASLARSTGNSAGSVIKTSHGAIMESGDKSEERNIEEEALPKHSSENKDNTVDDDNECSPQIVQMADMTDGSQRNTGQSIQKPLGLGNEDSIHDTAISFSTNCDNKTDEISGGSQILARVTTASGMHAEMKQDETTNEAKLATEEEKKKVINKYSLKLPSLDLSKKKLPSLGVVECTAENDLHDLNTEAAYWQSEERLPGGSCVPFGTFPINGNQSRRKSKALSDANLSKRFSNGEDDSHESVESCNSAGLLSNGKRQLKYEESLVFESKRLKQVDRSSVSMSTVKNDSSFMSWISNMVNGFGKSNEEEHPSLAHALDHADAEHASFHEETMICSEQHDSVSRNMGFQTIFQSLYSQNTKLIEARVSKDDCSLEESRGILQADKTNVVNSPISCSRQNGSFHENVVVSNDKTIPKSDAEIYSGLPYVLSSTIPVQVDHVAELAENKASECRVDRDRIVASESLGMHMITRAKNDPDFASEGRQVNDMSNRNNLFGSLWITRFSPKTGSSTLNLEQSKQVSNRCETWESPDLKAVSSQSQKNPDLAMKHKCWEVGDGSNETSGDFLVKELQMFASNTEYAVGFKEIHGHNQQNTVLQLNPLLPSQTLKGSEAIASVFARRLDAFKHIIPRSSKNEAACAVATCFFCGKSGHSLGDCSEVTKTELDHLLRNICSYVGAAYPCLCIRCFQLDHWAAACPRGSSSRVEKSKFFSVGNLKLLPIDERTQFLEKEEHDKVTVCSGQKSCTYMDIEDPVINGDSLVQRSLSSNETQKQRTSNSWDNSSGGYHNLHLSNLVGTDVINMQQRIFDAARRLQVYRADILKLMKSHVLMPHLEGFFLRLRLGKWEAGLGGTGYYVACITGQAGKAVKDFKKSICVNVGGIKCQVGSQYVSNQDFFEDEFMTWWCRTQRSGGKLPTKDELESKFKQRINLGF